ncbi:hypothetical protein [Agrobacterium burrii]
MRGGDEIRDNIEHRPTGIVTATDCDVRIVTGGQLIGDRTGCPESGTVSKSKPTCFPEDALAAVIVARGGRHQQKVVASAIRLLLISIRKGV